MLVSEITVEKVLVHLREKPEALSSDEKDHIQLLLDAAIAYVKGRTGINGVDEPDSNGRKLDDYEDITDAVMVLVSDMYDNRQYSVDKSDVNRVAESILSLHQFNFLPGEKV